MPYYAAYMETHMNQAAGFATVDASFLWPDGSGGIRGNGRMLQQVRKSASNNIYVYLAHSLKDTALSGCRDSVLRFLSQTFWNNSAALQCKYAGLPLALMSYKVDRAFWTIGKGGVGQSRFTSLINSDISPRHGYLDTSDLFTDEELRRQLPLLAQHLVWTAHEAAEAGGSNKGIRPDL